MSSIAVAEHAVRNEHAQSLNSGANEIMKRIKWILVLFACLSCGTAKAEISSTTFTAWN
jgi:hypothetical protein